MIWANGYSAAYYASVIDPVTWREIGRIEITGGTVTRADSDLMESARLSCKNTYQGQEQWIRVIMDTRQDGDFAHVPIFTGLAVSPDRTIEGRFKTDDLSAYSVLKPADDIALPKGWYAPVGFVASSIVEQLLEVIPAPIETAENSPKLLESIVAEKGETNLSMARKVLQAVDWRFRILGDGTVQICPKSREAVVSFNALDNDCIEKEVRMSYDWYSCPNIFRATSGDSVAEARDDDPDSIFSTVSRGREIWKAEENCKLGDGESITEYAYRRLKEEQNAVFKLSYRRRFHPDVLLGDIVEIHYPEYDLVGNFLVTKQTITLGFGASTAEEVHGYGSE